MSSNKAGYDVAIGPCRVLLRILGIYPDPIVKRSWVDQMKFIVATSVILIFCNITQSAAVIKVWGDLNEVIEVLTTMDLPTGCAFFKLISMRLNGHVLSPLISSMMNDWKSSNTKEELRILWKNAKISRIMSITIISLAEGTGVTYIFMLLLFAPTKYNREKMLGNNDTEILRKPFFRAEFPYDMYKSPMYEITWAFQCISMGFSASSFSSVDSLFAVLVLHLCSQLNILRNNVKLLPLSLKDNWTGDSYQKLLARIIKKHILLERYASSIEDAFNVMFLVQMIVSSIVICLQGYEIVTMHKNAILLPALLHAVVIIIISTNTGGLSIIELMYMSYFIMCFMFSLFVYCYVAELLRKECLEVGDVVYGIDWYNFSVQNSKPLILIILRAKRPFQITAGKFVDFSLELYCSILKTSLGYLSMLLAIKDREG